MSNICYRVIVFWLLTVCLLGLGAVPVRGATPFTITPRGQDGCASGTVVGGTNRVANGDFSISAGDGPGIAPVAKFTSELPNVGPDTYPYDELGGGFSIISTGVFTVTDRSLVSGHPFLGDPRRDVAATTHYLYTKPSNSMYADGYALLWSQQVTLTVGTTYNFFAYFDNMLAPSVGDNNFIDPQITLLVNGIPAGSSIALSETPDEWLPVQFSFTLDGAVGTHAPVTLEIRDYAGPRPVYAGDDFAMTGINLKQCVSRLGLAFTNLVAIDNDDGTYDIPFVVTVRNYGVDALPLSRLQLKTDLSAISSASQSFQIVTVSSDTASLMVNSGFNGVSDLRLLTDSTHNTLDSGVTAKISFITRIKPGTGADALGPFSIQVVASAEAGIDEQTGSAIEVGDISTPGLDPDPNDDEDTQDPSEDAPTPIYLTTFVIDLPLVRR
jgi:hypothetical protein